MFWVVVIAYQIQDSQMSSFCASSFYSLDSIFRCTKFLNFQVVQFIFSFVVCAFGIINCC